MAEAAPPFEDKVDFAPACGVKPMAPADDMEVFRYLMQAGATFAAGLLLRLTGTFCKGPRDAFRI
jgi:hypothetical protein